jgi:hypothetical protein
MYSLYSHVRARTSSYLGTRVKPDTSSYSCVHAYSTRVCTHTRDLYQMDTAVCTQLYTLNLVWPVARVRGLLNLVM